MPELPFSKGHALGNDYLVINAADLPWPLTPARVRALCDRHRGIGADGMLLGSLGEAPFALRIFNPDGSKAEKSGNGLRIFAAYLHGRGLVGSEPFAVRLAKDEVTLQVQSAGPVGVLDVVADMGRASFQGEDVGYRKAGEVLGDELELPGGGTARVHPVSLGNPHCVVFVDELGRDDFLRRAPALATHPAFAAGSNVQFARVAGPDRLEAWIYERGAGETLASGSSACAVAAAALRLGLVTARELVVNMPGGSLEVRVQPDWEIQLRGPAQIVYHGRVSAPMVEAWGRLG
ncbi:MAG: diaminopimelate epimerase [Gemmatimonadetes bacterium]|nr:diaminopimelate epimerase [Gemmatimonadota bacterium]